MARPGLRLSKAVRDELGQAYEGARGRKDLDMAERIQGLLLVNEGVGERRAAQIVGVGGGEPCRTGFLGTGEAVSKRS